MLFLDCVPWKLTDFFVSAFQKLYTEAWDEDKTMYYPYSDSPELRRVAKAQEVLSDVSLQFCQVVFHLILNS